MKHALPLFIIIALCLGFIITSGILFAQNKTLRATISDLTQHIDETISQSEVALDELSIQLANTEADRDTLQQRLHEEKERNDDFERQIKSISGTVTILDKIAKTDEELLQKYSKVYFLNEHYTPSTLSTISEEFLTSEDRLLQFHSQALPFLEELLTEAEEDGLDLRVTSAFRSFENQSALKHHYTVTYGAGTANTFSADQGYSEHQLGTAVDFTTPALKGAFNPFKDTAEYEWLLENAHKYGFILSYPEDNTYYQFEPWHWRFVGVELAKYLHKEDLNFYDVDQRKINEYIATLFDR